MRAFGGFVISVVALGGACTLASGCGSEDASALTDGLPGGGLDEGGLHFGNVRVGDGGTCYAQVRKGETLPLDMYVLLDKSSSMLEPTPSGLPKWDLIRIALEGFLKDPASSGIGIGLQYFPLRKPGVPATCTSHADCGANGPCFLTACTNATTLTLCQSDADCGGPRAQGACELFGGCETHPPGADPSVCSPIGTACPTGYGRCLDIADRFCVNGTECNASAYAAPAVPIATLPGGLQPLVTSLRSTMPEGNTPTAPALQGALTQARSWSSAHPGHKVVAVLATDGLPTECTPTDISQVAAIAGAGGGQIPVFVIGVFTAEDTASPANLNAIAKAGGTGQAFIVQTNGDVTNDFMAALDAIRGSALLSCELQVPPGNTSSNVDYFRVNLQMSPASGDPKQLVYVKDAAGCSASPGVGWYYDIDPAGGGTPTKIIVCPDVCTSFQALPGAKIDLQIGCKTIVH